MTSLFTRRDLSFFRSFIRKRARYCQHNWFNMFEFLHYDVSKDAVFCHTCIQAVQQKKIRKVKKGNPAFVSIIIDLFIDSKV